MCPSHSCQASLVALEFKRLISYTSKKVLMKSPPKRVDEVWQRCLIEYYMNVKYVLRSWEPFNGGSHLVNQMNAIGVTQLKFKIFRHWKRSDSRAYSYKSVAPTWVWRHMRGWRNRKLAPISSQFTNHQFRIIPKRLRPIFSLKTSKTTFTGWRISTFLTSKKKEGSQLSFWYRFSAAVDCETSIQPAGRALVPSPDETFLWRICLPSQMIARSLLLRAVSFAHAQDSCSKLQHFPARLDVSISRTYSYENDKCPLQPSRWTKLHTSHAYERSSMLLLARTTSWCSALFDNCVVRGDFGDRALPE